MPCVSTMNRTVIHNSKFKIHMVRPIKFYRKKNYFCKNNN